MLLLEIPGGKNCDKSSAFKWVDDPETKFGVNLNGSCLLFHSSYVFLKIFTTNLTYATSSDHCHFPERKKNPLFSCIKLTYIKCDNFRSILLKYWYSFNLFYHGKPQNAGLYIWTRKWWILWSFSVSPGSEFQYFILISKNIMTHLLSHGVR